MLFETFILFYDSVAERTPGGFIKLSLGRVSKSALSLWVTRGSSWLDFSTGLRHGVDCPGFSNLL